MMNKLPDAPAAYRNLVERLVNRGFVADVSDPDATAFGNQVAVLSQDNVRLRLVRDRGEWFLEIAAPLTDEWFSPAVWMALLARALPDARRPTPEEEADFVGSSWPVFDPPSQPTSSELLAELRAWRDRRAAQRREPRPEAT